MGQGGVGPPSGARASGLLPPSPPPPKPSGQGLSPGKAPSKAAPPQHAQAEGSQPAPRRGLFPGRLRGLLWQCHLPPLHLLPGPLPVLGEVLLLLLQAIVPPLEVAVGQLQPLVLLPQLLQLLLGGLQALLQVGLLTETGVGGRDGLTPVRKSRREAPGHLLLD